MNSRKRNTIDKVHVQRGKTTLLLFKRHRSTDNFNNFYLFISCPEMAHNNKNSVVKIQNLVNHESRPFKSNPDCQNNFEISTTHHSIKNFIDFGEFRSSRSQMFFKIDVKNFAIFTGKHLC